MKLEPVKMPIMKTRLSLEALYYYSASYHLNEAKKSLPELQKELKHYSELEEEIRAAEYAAGWDPTP